MADRPSEWLIQNIDLIPRDRLVLDVASGRGRNALYLAAAGWPVHAVDRSADALNALQDAAQGLDGAVTTECLDLETGLVSLGTGRYGAVIVFNYLHRPLMAAIVNAVAGGGVLIYQTFTSGQAARGHPRNPDFLLREGELPTLVSPLEVVRSREGDVDGSLVASIVAQRR